MRLAPLLLALVAATAFAQKEPAVTTLRGAEPIPQENRSEPYRMERRDRVLPRSHKWQPPVIPHHIKGYQITKNVNTCMTCHSSKAAPQTGATPVSKTHYLDRDGKRLPNVSTRRYFCLQCHVPQYDADPLVESTFRGPK